VGRHPRGTWGRSEVLGRYPESRDPSRRPLPEGAEAHASGKPARCAVRSVVGTLSPMGALETIAAAYAAVGPPRRLPPRDSRAVVHAMEQAFRGSLAAAMGTGEAGPPPAPVKRSRRDWWIEEVACRVAAGVCAVVLGALVLAVVLAVVAAVAYAARYGWRLAG